MKTKLTTFIAILCFGALSSQTIYEEFQSAKLGASRELKIQLPRNYEENTEKLYPIFIVFDGDYLFEPIAGNVDYYSYWEDMPEAIVVGINQVNTRDEDTHYSDQTYFPVESGVEFFEFIGMELMPYIEDKYRTANFRVAVGHGETANFINYYLFKKEPLFNAYIALSPDLAMNMLDNLPTRLSEFEKKIFYYLATSTNDIKPLKEDANILNTRLSGLENKNVFFSFDEFDGPTHY